MSFSVSPRGGKNRHNDDRAVPLLQYHTMDVANQVADTINKGFAYLRTNAWPILFLIGVVYVVKTKSKSVTVLALGTSHLLFQASIIPAMLSNP